MLRFRKHINSVPPTRYFFVCPYTGMRFTELIKKELFIKIEKFYLANNLPLSNEWKSVVENRICELLPPEWCEFCGDSPHRLRCTLSKERLIAGMKALTQLLVDKFFGKDIFVSQEIAEKRAEICARCHMNTEVDVCLSCRGMSFIAQLTGKLKGIKKTKSDYLLKNCCVCGCKTDSIVHIKNAVLNTGQTEESMLNYPNWCWKRFPDAEVEKSKDYMSV